MRVDLGRLIWLILLTGLTEESWILLATNGVRIAPIINNVDKITACNILFVLHVKTVEFEVFE